MTAMISNNIAMAADAGANVASQDVQNKLTALGGSKNLSPEAKEKKLREACEGFESIFIQKMWQEMRKTVPQNGLMHSKEEHYWQDMYDQELAKKMTSAGGIGLADMMYEQLSRNLVSASRGTASAMAQNQRAFVPEAAPFMPTTPAEIVKNEEPQANNAAKPQVIAPNAKKVSAPKTPAMTAAAIYDGAAPVEDHGPAPEATPAKVAAAEAPATPGNGVDPTLDNPAVSQALASLKQEQHKLHQNAPAKANAAAQGVTPEQAFAAAAQPVHHEMSPIERTQMVRRDIGDQLGSRGVRNPIKPQTAKAQARTEQARARRQAKQRFESLSAQNQPQTPAQAQVQAQAQIQAPQELKRSSTTEVTPLGSRAGAGIAAYHEQQRAAQVANTPEVAPTQPVAPLTVGTAPKLDGQQMQSNGIPPLTVSDLRI